LVVDATSVVTSFRFAIATGAQGTELRKFNDRFIEAQTKVQDLSNHIDDLRTHCHKVNDHATRISHDATATGFARIFAMLNLSSPQRELDLGRKLEQLANEDFNVANGAKTMVKALKLALDDVQNTLGPPGAMHEENIPAAASLLGQYSPHFRALQEEASAAATEIRDVVRVLR
jgi:hypothetical protein